MDELELNRQLQLLIQEACSSGDNAQRRKAMHNLLRLLLTQGILQRTSQGAYAEFHEEALSKIMFKLSNTLCDKYDLNRASPLSWIKTCYRNQLKDEIRAANRQRKKLSLINIENHPELHPVQSDITITDETLELRQWIIKDPDGVLSNCCIRDNPKANCHLLARLHIVQQREWREIAEEIGVSSNTLRSHWSRKCKFLIQNWFREDNDLLGKN